jgi:2-polyprenyl-3-methyl-5-hydroxy-6-metoxy-1,4-benzoquinol methylase
MTQEMRGLDELRAETLAGWETNAAYFDDQLDEDGDEWQRELIGPVVERFLELGPKDRLLEVACGNGVFARRMARLGVQVTATDFSPKMIEVASARAPELSKLIDYSVADANDKGALAALAETQFDAAVCNMSIMSIPELKPMYEAVYSQVKPGGSFVVSTLHPAFATTLPKVEKEEVETDEGTQTAWSIKLARYKNPFVSKGVAIIGQPEPQFYFHRPLEYLLVEPFEVGWVLDALEEPTLTQKQRSKLRMMWETLPEIPPVIVMRFKRPAG